MVKILIFILIMLAVVSFFWHEEISDWLAKRQSEMEQNAPGYIQKGSEAAQNWWDEKAKAQADLIVGKLTVQGKAKIDAWIENKGYNQYGDTNGTLYTGGTPLLNEATGESIDRYSYILLRHPDLVKELGLEKYFN